MSSLDGIVSIFVNLTMLIFVLLSMPFKGSFQKEPGANAFFQGKERCCFSISAPISTVTTALPLAPSYVEDEEISPCNADLRPRKRRVVEEGAGAPLAVDLSKVSPKFVVQDTVMMLVE